MAPGQTVQKERIKLPFIYPVQDTQCQVRAHVIQEARVQVQESGVQLAVGPALFTTTCVGGLVVAGCMVTRLTFKILY